MTPPPKQPTSGAGGFRRAYVHALATSSLSATERATARALAEFADWSTGGRCWPSVQTLADWLGVTARSVTRAITALEHHGWIALDRRAGRATSYTLTIMTPDTVSPLTQCHPCHNVRGHDAAPLTQSQTPLTQSHPTPDTESDPPDTESDDLLLINQRPPTYQPTRDIGQQVGGLEGEPLGEQVAPPVDLLTRVEQLIIKAKIDPQGRDVRLVMTPLLKSATARGVLDDDVAATVASTLADVKIVAMRDEGARWGYWRKMLKRELDGLDARDAAPASVTLGAADLPRELQPIHPDDLFYGDPDIKTYGDLDRAAAAAPQVGTPEYQAVLDELAVLMARPLTLKTFDPATAKEATP